MASKMLVTTSDTIQGAQTVRYLDLVSAHVVLGSNVLSEFKASFVDFFGGRSGTYQNKLREIYDHARSEIEREAMTLGANAIVGFRIDFDEISGKGVSMFMVSAIGTAVQVEYSDPRALDQAQDHRVVSCDSLQKQIHKTTIVNRLRAKTFPSEATWDYLFRNPIDDIFAPLLTFYIEAIKKEICSLSAQDVLLKERFPIYCGLVDKTVAEQELYAQLPQSIVAVSPLIIENHLFAPEHIIELLNNHFVSEAISCLSADKDYYTEADLALMRQIVGLLQSLPDEGEVKEVKGMISTKPKYVCPNGHKNDSTVEFCSTCGLNKQGLTERQVSMIKRFILKVDSLEVLLRP